MLRALGNKALDIYGKWRARRYDVSDTIVVSCTGRSGSTWLAQIIASLPRHHLLWEQLHWRSNPDCSTYGFGKPLYLTPDRATREQEAYVRDILVGRTLPRAVKTQFDFRPWALLTLRAYVAKFVTANMLLPWMVDMFGVRAIYMVRHPCAVVASQLRHGKWDEVEKSFCHHPALFDEYPHISTVFDNIQQQEEILAFNWAVQNFVPLIYLQDSPDGLIATTYEEMHEERMGEVTRLFRELGEEIPSRAESRLNQPSTTTKNKDSSQHSQAQLAKWRRHLSETQINRILSVTHEVGISLYTRALRPVGPMTNAVTQTEE